MARGARGALAVAILGLVLALSGCFGGAGAPPTPTPPPTTAPLPTVPRPALDTPVAAQASAAPSNSAVHVVQAGETLGQIALRYYGDANRWQVIYDANRGQLSSPSALAVNMRLTIPPLSAATTTPATPTSAPR
ncbi:MAG TPA: LysM peptidoglycan-binding domain-containing protein [Chloroflexota bacterium]|nr:LysM peptidoglycan-binding domain-containing protein [Chloroflexota bacterium]